MNPTGTVIGYDPGGNGAHGVARMILAQGEAQQVETKTLVSAEKVIEFIENTPNIIGLGVDTLTCWSTGESGWRPADRWLRKAYPAAQLSVVSPNGLYGSMGLNGMATLVTLREKHPELFITETHPKVLYRALSGQKYDYVTGQDVMDQYLVSALGLSLSPANDHEWDAAISAFCALQGLMGRWKQDLHKLPTSDGERLVKPCGKTFFSWPELPLTSPG